MQLPNQHEEEEEQQQQQRFPAIAAPIPSPPADDFFRFRIDGSDILEDIQHQLKGEVYDHAQGGYVSSFDRWINDDGINKILHIIYACGINKNIFLGNLTKEEIMFKCNMLKKKLALLMFKKYNEFGVSKEMRDLLIMTVVGTVHSALSRSEGGREADQISTAAQRVEMFQRQEKDQQQPGIMSRLSPFGRRNQF